MFKLVFSILKNPGLLLQATLIPNKIMRRFLLQLVVITSIPLLITSFRTLNNIQNDFTVITQKAPEFHTQAGIMTSTAYEQTFALQTDSTYFLYDIENQVDASTILQVSQQNYFSIILTKTNYTLYSAFGMPIQQINFSRVPFDTSALKTQLYLFSNMLNGLYFVVPFIVFVAQLLTILMSNLSFTALSHIFFLLLQKRVRWNHLWRVSLLASIAPYIIITLFNLCNIYIPFSSFFIGLFILCTQYIVLKESLRPKA